MDTLDNLSVEDILIKLEKFEKQRLQHNARVKRYREANLEYAREYSCKKATEYYWRKKGFTIDENGNKIPIKTDEVLI
tara:strand:+ start:156 stop:389 length:234 start_codon:yes stop_codon:yes gene_type:complete